MSRLQELRVGLARRTRVIRSSRAAGAARRLPAAAKIAVGVVVAVIVAGLVYLAVPGTPTITVTANFSEAPGLFVGNFVEVLGVPVGRITAITPGPRGVSVRMLVPDNVPIPRGAHAVLEAPDVVNDRYVQLMPAYTGGPRMVSGTVIPTAAHGDPGLGGPGHRQPGFAGEGARAHRRQPAGCPLRAHTQPRPHLRQQRPAAARRPRRLERGDHRVRLSPRLARRRPQQPRQAHRGGGCQHGHLSSLRRRTWPP